MGIFWKFDPAKNEWSKLPSNPVPVHHGASASIGRKFYVFGGFRLPDTGKVGWYESGCSISTPRNGQPFRRCLRRAAHSR